MSDAGEIASGILSGILGIAGTATDHKEPVRVTNSGEVIGKARRGEKEAKITHKKHLEKLKAAYERERNRRKAERSNPDSRKGHEANIKTRHAKAMITRINKHADKEYEKEHGKPRPKGHRIKVTWQKKKFDNVDVYHPVRDPKGKNVLIKASFEQYLNWLNVINEASVTDENWDSTEYEGAHGVLHKARINGHRVHVGYNDYDGDGNYEVSFSVNGTTNRHKNRVQTQRDAGNIMRHVHKSVKTFMQTHKPKKITYSADDEDKKSREKKASLYSRWADKSGAKQKVDPNGHKVLSFEQFLEWKNTPSSREIGTTSLSKIYASMTPGESNGKRIQRHSRNKKSKKGC